MSIIPAHCLSSSDLRRLGNNLGTAASNPLRHRFRRAELAAVNRSLAIVGEQVRTLHRPRPQVLHA